MRKNGVIFFAMLCLLSVSAPGEAQTGDPVNDFIPGYVGLQNGDMDVLSAEVIFDGVNLNLTATLNGAIGTTPGALYVWGFDRGQGTSRFPAIAPGVLFDSVVIVRPDTTVSATRIVGGGTTNFPAGTASIIGNIFTATIPADTLPSLGFAPSEYTWNLWPRQGVGNNNQISDFAPDNSNVQVSAVAPEPSTVGFIVWGGGFLLTRVLSRRKR